MYSASHSSCSAKELWEEGLPLSARTLRNLLREVDSASVPLWTGPQLDAAIYRYTKIFLPMLEAHLGAAKNKAGIHGMLKCADMKHRK